MNMFHADPEYTTWVINPTESQQVEVPHRAGLFRNELRPLSCCTQCSPWPARGCYGCTWGIQSMAVAQFFTGSQRDVCIGVQPTLCAYKLGVPSWLSWLNTCPSGCCQASCITVSRVCPSLMVTVAVRTHAAHMSNSHSVFCRFEMFLGHLPATQMMRYPAEATSQARRLCSLLNRGCCCWCCCCAKTPPTCRTGGAAVGAVAVLKHPPPVGQGALLLVLLLC